MLLIEKAFFMDVLIQFKIGVELTIFKNEILYSVVFIVFFIWRQE